MSRVRATFRLPYLLPLPDGVYGGLTLDRETLEERGGAPGATHTRIYWPFESDANDPDERLRVAQRRAEDSLVQTNRLLRWHRVATQQGAITELTRAQASPVTFTLLGENGAADEPFVDPLVFEEQGVPQQAQPAQVAVRVRDGLAAGVDPPVGELFLLDADQARRAGRFREAVLFCWSTIDSVFSGKYAQLVNARLAGEWAYGREFFTQIGEVPMKVRMTGALYLLAERSLFRDEREMWADLTTSYDKRNAIIHGGDTATEDDATKAIRVARRLVEVIAAIPLPAAGPLPAPDL